MLRTRSATSRPSLRSGPDFTPRYPEHFWGSTENQQLRWGQMKGPNGAKSVARKQRFELGLSKNDLPRRQKQVNPPSFSPP
jgi:hypothetical protein